MQTDEIVRWSAFLHGRTLPGFIVSALWPVYPAGTGWGISGWAAWLGNATELLLCVVLLRRWAQYCVTLQPVTKERIYGARHPGVGIRRLPLFRLPTISPCGPMMRWPISSHLETG
jgi:hypothetical protein